VALGDPRLAALIAQVRAVDGRLRLRLNHNRRTLLTLRVARDRSGTLSLHPGFLDHPAALAEIPTWIRQQGRGGFPGIAAALRSIGRDQRSRILVGAAGEQLRALPILGGPFDLTATVDRLHATWFRHLPALAVTWARDTGTGHLSHMRFGCYRRNPARISLHPRLDRPWIARVFVEHVLFHEICHHAQACAPLAGETAHSARFRLWERRFPGHDLAMTWERAFVHHLLDDTKPDVPGISGTVVGCAVGG